MHARCWLYKLCALLMIHIQAMVQSQMINEHDAFKSAGSHQPNAFYALRSCHQVLHGNSGEFFSPDYLCSNPALWCNWTIQVQPGKRVQVYLVDLTPEQLCHLKTDQIHLDETPVSVGESRMLERCWRSSVYMSISNTVHVVQLIRPNPNPPHRGFYGVYQAFGLPDTPDLNEGVSEEEQVQMEARDAVTQISRQKNVLNEMEEKVEKTHVKHAGVRDGIDRQLNEVLAATTGSFREIRKIRGEAKNQEAPFHGDSPQNDIDEWVSLPTGIPNWTTVEKYTTMFDDGSHTLVPAYTIHSIRTTLKQSTKKRAPKRKPVLAQPSATTTTTAGPTNATPLVEDIGAVSTEMLKNDGVPTFPPASEKLLDSLVESKPKSEKMKQSHEIKDFLSAYTEKSLPVQTFRLATEPPDFPVDCSRTSVPTLLYAVCFLLCFLIALLMVVLGVTYRRYHHGTFLPRCWHSGSFTDNDINNNPNSGGGDVGRVFRSPPPPPPLPLSGGAQALRLLRFSPLTPPDGFEGKAPREKDTL